VGRAACPNSLDPGRFLSDEEFALALEASPPPSASPLEVEIGRRKIMADKVVSGPLCNDTWRGTVYVTCDARVAAWSDAEAPTFLKGCNLDVESGTVVSSRRTTTRVLRGLLVPWVIGGWSGRCAGSVIWGMRS
jgi:hypothetical protein